MLTKETFVKAMNELIRARNYQEDLNNFFESHCSDGYIYQPDCSDSLVSVLEEAMNQKPGEDGLTDIAYFCYELEYGRKYKDGCYKNDKGEDVDISTPELLYDYIVSGGDVH